MSPNERRIRRWELECARVGHHIPWVRVESFSSYGMQHRIPGRDDRLVGHMHSNPEEAWYLRKAFEGGYVSILTQVPLVPLAKAREVAKLCGLRYPRDPENCDWAVLSSDLVTQKATNGRLEGHAYAVKTRDELNGPEKKSIEIKLEIEKQFNLYLGNKWELIVDDELNEQETDNIRRLYDELMQHPPNWSAQQLADYADCFQKMWTPDRQLRDLLARVERRLRFTEAQGWNLFAASIQAGHLRVDLAEPIDEDQRIWLKPD